jgi:hypothetical protein
MIGASDPAALLDLPDDYDIGQIITETRPFVKKRAGIFSLWATDS